MSHKFYKAILNAVMVWCMINSDVRKKYYKLLNSSCKSYHVWLEFYCLSKDYPDSALMQVIGVILEACYIRTHIYANLRVRQII